jgi:hypothetical protein
VLLGRAEAHDPLDAGPVVPRPVEHHDLAGIRQVLHIPLEVPLGAFLLGRLLQCDDAGAARVEVLHEPLDGAALARRVTALENEDVPVIVGLAPLLELEQLDLQQPLLLLVLNTRHALVIRIVLSPGVHYLAAGLNDQLGIVVIVVAHGIAV